MKLTKQLLLNAFSILILACSNLTHATTPATGKESLESDFTLHIAGTDFSMTQSFVPVTGAIRPIDKEWANAKVFMDDHHYETNIVFSGENITLNFPIRIPIETGHYPINGYGQPPSKNSLIKIFGSLKGKGSYRATGGELVITHVSRSVDNSSVLEGYFESDLAIKDKSDFKISGAFRILDPANKVCCR